MNIRSHSALDLQKLSCRGTVGLTETDSVYQNLQTNCRQILTLTGWIEDLLYDGRQSKSVHVFNWWRRKRSCCCCRETGVRQDQRSTERGVRRGEDEADGAQEASSRSGQSRPLQPLHPPGTKRGTGGEQRGEQRGGVRERTVTSAQLRRYWIIQDNSQVHVWLLTGG